MKKNIFLENSFSKVKRILLLIVIVAIFFSSSIRPAEASPVVTFITDAWNSLVRVVDKTWTKVETLYNKSGKKIFNSVLRNSLNRIAYDAAKYAGTAGEGQKPLFVVEDFGKYVTNLGDAAAGDLIAGIGENWYNDGTASSSGAFLDLCKPADPILAGKIGLGLVQQQKPAEPACKATDLYNNWSSAYDKIAAMESGDYVEALKNAFDPSGGEIGVSFSLFNKMNDAESEAKKTTELKLAVNKGWIDVRSPAGKAETFPGQTEEQLKSAQAKIDAAYVAEGDDPFISSANIFLNQLALEAFQRGMRELTKAVKPSSQPADYTKLTNTFSSSAFESLVDYGESVVSEKLATVIKPHFDTKGDFSILGELATCISKDNSGPTNCVIDDKFSQAVSEKLTVGEALKKGYIHGDWLVTDDAKADNAYSLRSASILRKYRVVPVGWEQAISVATSKGYRVTFQDLISCFNGKGQFSSNFDKNNQSWCRGLVDPNWVLKAPLNSCAKEGVGSQIMSSQPSKDASGVNTVVISRANNYCADEQTCIKEKADGSCEVYGYCNEEKRTWKFGSESCEPVYNTCQTFISNTDKQTVSFLENTLDYSTCDANNSGCKQYSYSGSYSSTTNSIAWDKNYSTFFNNKAVSCDAANESCTKLLRGKPGWIDVNYIMNADFGLNNIGDNSASTTDWHWPITNGVGTIAEGSGSSFLSIKGGNGAGVYSNNDKNLLPKNLEPISGWSYTLSAEVKINSGDKVVMSFGSDNSLAETTSKEWTTISVTANNTNNLDFKLVGFSTDNVVEFSVRNLKLAPNNYFSGFSNYAAFPLFEKLLPSYLESSCYNSASDHTLKDNAPTVCSNFARKCNRAEVGCELFTSVKDIFSVAAKANVNDYCDAKCVGYDTYIAKASTFYGASADNIIPANTTTCTAENVGCASFTNLDAVTAGGENVEYYTKVRQCIKPDTASCGDFYAWDNAQLKVMSLKKDAGGDPETIKADNCENTYNLPVTDPNYNPDCREFYSKAGKITHRLISNTISCSDDCHAYRLNEKSIDKTLDAGSCKNKDNSKPDKYWDTAQNTCYVCQNGGVWDAKQSACVYQVVPSEGTTCEAKNVGCREYNGSNGNNLKLVASYDFEADANGFSLANGGTVNQSTESTVKNGHSLNITNNVSVDASNFAKKDSAYVAKFMAKSSVALTANFYFENSKKEKAIFGVDDKNPGGDISIKGDSQWHIYEINLDNLNHATSNETLKIETDNNFVIDNLIINEITDRYYLIQGSSQVPDVCYYDMSDVYQGPNYNLGCAAYTDRSKVTHNIHQFSELCQNSAVGCEQMILTNNNSSQYSHSVNLNSDNQDDACTPGTPGCVNIGGAEAIYAVFDSTKQCNKADAGCSRFGYLKTSGNSTSWVDVYKKNLPDTYKTFSSSPVCQASEVGCDTWIYGSNSASYFKNPGLNTCVFKDGYWYKSPVKRCDASSDGKITDTEKNGLTCLSDSDCGTKKCITDNNDYPCAVSYLKTMGLGGVGGRVAVPDGSAGLCNNESSGCGEYIDPVSKYVNNLVYNPSAQEIDKLPADKWTSSGNGYYSQKITLKQNKLYILQVDGSVTQPVILDKFSTTENGQGGVIRILNANNKLGDLVTTATTSSSIIFNSSANSYVTVYRYGITTDQNYPAAAISVKEAVINYQLNSNIDTTSCNGTVNTDAGCVLFNVRSQAGNTGLKKNIFNATLTNDGASPAACDGTDTNCVNNANTVVKVSPDRVCSRWLSCQTYTEDPVTHEKTCYKMGECDQLNEKNECGNFLSAGETVRDIKNSQNKNATGYALLNNWYIGSMKEVGQNTDAHYDFENSTATLSCRRDIDVAGNSALNAVSGSNCSFDKNINDSLVLSPSDSQSDYPAHGKGFLKVLNFYQISPLSNNSSISIYSNQDYYINYLVNTKGSKAKAKLLITDYTTKEVKASFVDEASNGWERKVYKINLNDASGNKVLKKVKIYLTSNATDLTTGYVYFDDINIEPVLQTGANTYVPKDCRLYPSEDSLSCLSSSNNVVKDGLFGYCLQYDKLNPSVCLMWYPVDQISTVSNSSQSVMGYSGKMPLYYCTEANGKFDLVEKRVGVLHGFATGASDMGTIVNRILPADTGYNYDGTDHLSSDSVDCSSVGITKTGGGDCRCLSDSSKLNKAFCASDNYSVLTFTQSDDGQKIVAYCAPKQSALSVISNSKTVNLKDINGGWDCQFTFNEGWGKYDGFLRDEKRFSQGNGSHPLGSDGVYPIDESANTTGSLFDSVMIVEQGKSSESDLKYVSNVDPDKVYRMSCNKFSEMVNTSGENVAWSNRISRNSTFTSDTPNFFNVDTNGFQSNTVSRILNDYGRNREDVPFGAAVLTSDYDFSNSGPILLRNQYSKKMNETLFAGRPYGCFGTGCVNIGQCSLDKNIFCIYNISDDEFNKKSCSANGSGVCEPLWGEKVRGFLGLQHIDYGRYPTQLNAINNLNQLFIEKYDDLIYSGDGYISDPSAPGFFDISNNGPDTSHKISSFDKIKKVVPIIKNEDFRLLDGETPVTIDNGFFNIDEAGLYQLSFNSIIDPEQQPLKQITINWGDGIQVITGLDNKPEAGTPHKFYHFYLKGTKLHLEVKITDNWEAFKCSAMSGNTWGGVCSNTK